MLKDAQRRRFDVVMAWAIDRLGRSLIDLLATIQTLEACDIDLYLDQQSIDTTTPAGRLMFQITGAFAEFERSMIRQRVRAGLKRAVESGKQLGRPKIDPATEKRIQAQLRAKKGIWPLLGILRLALARFSVLSARWRRPALSAAPPRKAAADKAQAIVDCRGDLIYMSSARLPAFLHKGLRCLRSPPPKPPNSSPT